jgi:hypothetical protein
MYQELLRNMTDSPAANIFQILFKDLAKASEKEHNRLGIE